MLNENKRSMWMKARKLWVEKENEYTSMLRQKARIRWDAEGDENSKNFHSYVRRRNNMSNIRGLTINEVWSGDPALIKAAMARHRITKCCYAERLAVSAHSFCYVRESCQDFKDE
ncbi:hypothetical protein Tco_1403831 [Tanacetum coccineum]